MTEASVLQLRVALLGVEPGVWRRIQVPGESTFWDLHVAIQDAMGWTDSHLHEFRVADPGSEGRNGSGTRTRSSARTSCPGGRGGWRTF